MISKRLLLWGIGFELTLSAIFIYLPPFQHLLGTTALPVHLLLLTVPFPLAASFTLLITGGVVSAP